MRTHSIAAIPADGIGPEVISAGVRVLEALAKRSGDLAFNIKTFDWGSDYYKKHGLMMPADGPCRAQEIRRDLFRRGRRARRARSHHAVGPAAADLPGL
ncbi:isocitrate/isopropylmalate dehydrogenase [Bradyrhizobium sp. LM3.4]